MSSSSSSSSEAQFQSSESSQPPSTEGQFRIPLTSVPAFFPFFLAGLSFPSPTHENQQSSENGIPSGAVLNINPVRGSAMMVVFEDTENLQSILGQLSVKDGPVPASKASIEAMPVVKMMEEGAECAICLAEYETGAEAKEMPCKHRYHPECIEKWLGIHGSCPVCRYMMPAVEEEPRKHGGAAGGARNDGGENDGRGGRLEEGNLVVHFFFGLGDGRPRQSESGGERGPTQNNSDSGASTDNGDMAATE